MRHSLVGPAAGLGERTHELARRRKPVAWLLGQRARDDLLDGLRHPGTKRSHARRWSGGAARHHRARRSTLKGRRAGEHLVEHAAQGIEIAPAIHVLVAGRLLGAHVRRRSHGEAGARRAHLARQLDHVRDAEVGDVRVIVGEQDVRRLDVAVDDAVPMRVLERVTYFFGNAQRHRDGQWSFPLDALLERVALDVRHDEVGRVVPDAGVVQRQDVRMLHAGDRVDLGKETRWREQQIGLEVLQCDEPVVLAIIREVDDGGRAAAKLATNLVPFG